MFLAQKQHNIIKRPATNRIATLKKHTVMSLTALLGGMESGDTASGDVASGDVHWEDMDFEDI